MDSSAASVSYLGPEATFTHQAAIVRFGEGARLIPAPSISAVFDEVEAGRADSGIVPIENALEGTVNITLDRLIDSELIISAEVRLAIDIHLLSRAGEVAQIERVMSHPHAVAQCRGWLQENLAGVGVEEVASTSLAAELAAKNERLAALGSRMAAEHFGLNVMVEKVDGESINVTRFYVLGKEKAARVADARTSLVFVLKNEAGALYEALGPVASRGLNMTKIESRPSRRAAWDYIFFMEIDGHAEEGALAACLDELRGRVEYLRVLGSFPVID